MNPSTKPSIWHVAVLIVLAVLTRVAAAEMRLDVNEELRRAEALRKAEEARREAGSRMQLDPQQDLRFIERGAAPPRHIAGAKYRVAVFSFEDPDATGLGNTLTGLIGREMLLQHSFGSIGVLRYEGSLAPTPAQPLSYFDKVDLLVDAQDVTLAVWGMLRRTGDTVSIDVYAQLPPRVVEQSFTWSLRLPEAMGGRRLVAQLRPARMRIEHHEMSLVDSRMLAQTVRSLDTLLAEPKDGAAVVASLPVGSVYWIDRHEGDWAEISTGATKGWVRSTGFCVATCAPLLDAAHFASGLLDFIDNRRVPNADGTLTADAQAVRTQISVLEQLDTMRPDTFEPNVARPIARWLNSATDASRLPPGGAAFANVKALAEIATSVQAAIAMHASDDSLERRFNAAKVEPSRVREIAFELAHASVADPRNGDVLKNLAVLFDYAGERERAGLAAKLSLEAARDR